MRHPGPIALVPASIVAAVLAYFITSGTWQTLGIWPEPSIIGWTTGFADLANQTATADCLRDGIDITTCDPYGRPFTPYAVFPGSVLAALGLGVQQTGILGVGLAAVYVIVIWFLARTIARKWTRSPLGLVAFLAALTFAAITPPALLLVERGQMDILILALATAGLAAFAVNNRLTPILRALGAFGLFISVALKYFNIGVFAAFLAPRRWSWWAGAGILASAVFLAWNFGDLQTAQSTAGADGAATSRVMFGSATMFVTIAVADPLAFGPPPEQALPLTLFTVLGIAILLAFTAMWWLWFRNRQLNEPPGVTWFWIVGSAGSVGLPYLLGSSNDYRLILLLPLLAGAGAWLGRGGPVAPLVLVSALLVMSLATNAWMIPNPSGFVLPEWAMILGEITISATLAFGLALLIRQWTHHRRSAAVA